MFQRFCLFCAAITWAFALDDGNWLAFVGATVVTVWLVADADVFEHWRT